MNYIVCNIINKGEIRISNQELDGELIYKGHKLGFPDELLPHIIYYTYEKYNGTYNFLDYKKWRDIYNMKKITSTMTKCFFRDSDNRKALLNSYRTLLETLRDVGGDFKNIYVVCN